MVVLEFPDPDPDPDSLSDGALARLSAAIDAVQAVAIGGLGVDELESFTVGLLQQGERLAAATSEAVAECDRRGLARRRGSCASTTAHLASFTHGPTAPIAPARTNGRWLIDFPLLAEAWAAGTLTEAHVAELRRADNPRVHMLMKRDQQLHVDAAASLEFKRWLQHLAYWLLHADPDGHLPDERDRAYGLRLRTRPNGDVDVTGTLDPLAGEALLTMIDHEADAIRRHELEHDIPPIDQTPTRKRNALALLRLCRRGFQRPDGGWPAPLVSIVMSETVAEDLVSRMLDGDTHDPFTLPLDYNDIDGRCETIRGTPLDPRRAWPALICGRLRRQVMKAKSRKVDLGHDVRLFTAAQRHALLVMARGQCNTVGCDAPFTWLEADHIHPHSRGSQTNMEEGQMKCRPDNLRKSDSTELE